MKNKVLKWYLLAFLLISDIVVFAQPGQDSTDEDEVPLEGGDDAAPINAKIIYLAIAGCMFAYYYYSKSKKETAKN